MVCIESLLRDWVIEVLGGRVWVGVMVIDGVGGKVGAVFRW